MKRKILLVEDNPADAFLVKHHLEGHAVHHVLTFAQAVAAVTAEEYELILLDMHLPDGIGPALVGRLARHAPGSPIVVLTGSLGSDKHAREGLLEGAQDWLSKDELDADRLRRTVEYAIERKRLVVDLERTEERFRQLSENVSSTFWLSELDLSKVLFVSPAFERLTGTSRERLYEDASFWRRLVHPEDVPALGEAVARLTTDAAPLDMTFRIVRPDATLRWARMRGFTVRNAAGEVYRLAGTIDDVTALRDAQAQEAAAKGRLQAILDAAGEGICGLDAQGAISFINRAGADMLGAEPASVVGIGAHTLFHARLAASAGHEERDCPLHAALHDEVARRVEDDAFVTQDGRSFPVSYVRSPREDPEGGRGAVVVFTDTTERRRSQEALARAEARFRGIFMASSSRITLTDAAGVVLATNASEDRRAGETPPGVRITDLMAKGSPQAQQVADWLAAAAAGIPSRGLLLLEGQTVVRDVTCTPLGEPGPVAEILWEGRDVTELHRARREAEEAREHLAEVQRFRAQLVNNVAHDMSTPITVLELRLEVLQLATPRPDGARDLDERTLGALLQATRQLSILTRDLRDVSLMEAGTFQLHKELVDISSLARRTLDALGDIAKRAEVEIVPDLPPERAVVEGDPARLTQALTNLVTNAVKFTPPGGRVALRLRREGGRVHLDVVDEGPGVPVPLRPRLFQPFSQVHQDKAAKKGTGLGLYIVRGIVQAHGGDAAIVDTPGARGATFRITLPEARAA